MREERASLRDLGATSQALSGPLKLNRRHLAVAISAAAHISLVAWLVRAAPPSLVEPDARVASISLVLMDGDAMPPAIPASAPEPAPRPPPKPPEPTDIEPQFVEFAAPAPVAYRDPENDPLSDAVRAAASSSGQTCQIAAWLQQALQHDPGVNAALRDIPRPARSVANAMMFWDGAWTQPPAAASAGVGTIRAAITAGVRAAPTACQAAEVAGPEMMTLQIGADTTVIVVGSGRWRWADLVSTQDAVRAASPRL